MTDIQTLRERIEAAYPRLTPQLRRAAQYVLQAPEDVALYPVRRVAAAAGVGATTLLRLADELGFDSYDGFRETFRDSLREGARHYAARAHRLQTMPEAGDAGKLLARSAAIAARNMNETFARLSARELEVVAERLTRARKVYVIGLRSCYAPAFYFHYVAQTFTSRMVLVEGHKGMLSDELDDIGPDDVMLGISFHPYAHDTVRVMRYAAERGTVLVALTDTPVSPIAFGAAHVFLLPNESTSFYDSLVPSLYLLEALVAFVVARGGAETVEIIRSGFQRREDFGVYWREPERRNRRR